MAAITFYLSNTKNELIKLKGTFAMWLSVISGIMVPLLFFLVFFFRYDKLIPEEGINPWNKFMNDQVSNSIPFLVPMFIVLITSLIIQVEHKATGIKHLFALPIPKWSVYYSKLSIVVGSIVATYIYFFIAILIFGSLLGVLRPELNFLEFQPEYFKFIKILGMSFIASLGIVGLQFWLSFRFKNFIVPLAVGMIMVIIGLIVSRAPEAIYFPYAYNILSVLQGSNGPQIFGIPTVLVYSIIFFLITSVVGYLDIRRLNVK